MKRNKTFKDNPFWLPLYSEFFWAGYSPMYDTSINDLLDNLAIMYTPFSHMYTPFINIKLFNPVKPKPCSV